MSEEEKIEDQPTDNIPQSTDNNENVSHPSNINEQPTSKNMEVHKYPHYMTHKKKWGEYLLEFFMLFLAVFLGFVAENIREHNVERQREKEYIEFLIADSKSDQQVLEQHIVHVKSGLSIMDSMLVLLNTPSLITGNTGQLYFFARLAPRLKPLSINNRTLEQLKNSGNFRLIRNLTTSNKIMTTMKNFP